MKPLENTNWQAAIDRLVDGELTADAERELLAKLDHVADGWRICALAFVENRVLQREFASLQRSDTAQNIPITTVASNAAVLSTTSPRSRRSSHTNQLLTIAVSIAIAFVVGMFVPQFGAYFSKTSSPVVGGKEKPSNDPLPIATNVVKQQPQNIQSENVAADDIARNSATPLLTPLNKGIELQMVDRQGEYPTQSVKLPLTQLNEFNSEIAEALKKWTAEQPLPKELVQEAAFNGQQIQKESVLMPMKMSDGTQVIVPMQRVRFQPQEAVNWN